jgi:hypothetical protein
MTRLFAGLLAAGAALAVAACGSEHAASPSAPTAAVRASANGATSSNSLIGTWTSAASVAATASVSKTSVSISLSACTDIKMQITNQTATQATGTLNMTCPGGVSLSGTLVGQLGGDTMPLTWNGMATLPGIAACGFSLTGVGSMITADSFHLSYSGNTCLGPVHGEETLRLATATPPSPAPAVPPPQPPAAPPTAPPAPPPPSGFGQDGIDLSQATIRNSPLTLASWPITTAISVADLRPSGVYLGFSKRDGFDRWPDVTPPGWDGSLQWTLGMALNIGGRWYASAAIEFWYGLEESGGPPQDYALNWFYDPGRWAPMTGHQPAVGETIGLFACAGDCRNNTAGTLSPVRERSNVVLVTMPGPGGARFTF